jgi:nitrogen regulatory protein PII
VALGRSMAGNALLRALSLGDVLQDIVFTLLRGECEAVLTAIVEDSRRLGKNGGTAMLLDVCSVFARSPALAGGENIEGRKGEEMQSGYKLLTVIVNSGFGDDVMDAAHKAGAGGGTILSAHGTGREEDVKFFGVTMVPEKDMLLIATEPEKLDGILAAISKVPKLNEPGGGIVYTMNIEQFIRFSDV